MKGWPPLPAESSNVSTAGTAKRSLRASEQHRQEQADRASVEYVERQRVAEIVRRRDADSKDLLAGVKRRLDAGEDRETIKSWAEQREREIQAEAQREIDGK